MAFSVKVNCILIECFSEHNYFYYLSNSNYYANMTENIMHLYNRFLRAVYVFFLMILASCGSTVENFDQRLHKKYEKRGFVAQTKEIGDHQLFYYDNNRETDKPVLLFIHGFGGDGKISWFRQIDEFYEDYRVIVPDILWFGKSLSQSEPTLVNQVSAIQLLLKELNVSKVHAVGISYGGFIALGMAKKFPELLSSVVIVNSPGAAIKDEEIDRFCRKVEVKNIKEAFIPKNVSDLKRLLDFSFYKKPFIPTSLLDQVLTTYFSKHPEEQAQLLDELPSNRDRMSGSIDVPAKIIWGVEDEIFHVYDAYSLKKEIGAELEIIKNAGHALPGEQPKKFNAALRSYLNSL
jgi:pimeloyl-ACP methyl ester carboxylesterase